MLRRTLLLAALLAPLTALGQAISIAPVSPYTKAQCESLSYDVVLTWSLPAGSTIPTGATYRIVVSTSSGCDETSSALVVASGIAPVTSGADPGATNQRYPKTGDPSGTLTINTFVTKANAACSNNLSLFTCAQLMEGTAVRAKSNILQLQVRDGPPSTPVNVVVAPGEGALNVSWAEGTGGQVPTATYTARAYTLVPGCDPLTNAVPRDCLAAFVTGVSTAAKSARLTGLAIGTRYGVDVTAYSETATPSEPSAIAVGTPIVVNDFWEVYSGMAPDDYQDQGGCGSGSAGLLSLLAVAGLLRAARRRS